MSTPLDRLSSPGPQLRATPGAFPSSPAGAKSPTVSSYYSLSQAVHARRAEFTRSHTIRVKVGTWNVAALNDTDKDIGEWFVGGKGVSAKLSGLTVREEDDPNKDHNGKTINLKGIEGVGDQEARRMKKLSTLPRNDPGSLPGGDDIDIYVLGLQEIVDINSATEALRPFIDPHPAKKWKAALTEALPEGYHRIADQQLIGLLLLVYASPAIAPTVTSVSSTSVGTGLMGYMGNKGAVTTRIVLGETTRLVFINCHLAAGTEKNMVERRNWDTQQILMRTKFEPVYDGSGVVEELGEGIGDEDFAFWFGDLNYRLDSLPGEDVRRLLMLHTRNEYGLGEASSKRIESELSTPTDATIGGADDRASVYSGFSSNTATNSSSDHSSVTLPVDPPSNPASLQTTLSSLLPHDQLHMQMRARKAFYDGWREGPINFLPTYKYDVGSVGMFDSSEKRRGPSWCDRILYRTRRDRLEYERKVREEKEARKRDEELRARGVDKAVAEDEDVLFDYDPETDGADNDYDENNDAESEVVVTKSGYEDKLHLDYYTSHQRVLSSDHKPLDAVFTLTYDAVDTDLKAKVHQEVARELDKAENEGRPGVTVVVDHHSPDHDGSTNTDQTSASFEGVDFGDVRYDQAKSRGITIANTGRVRATFGLMDRPVDQQLGGASPPWLNIQFDRPSDNHNSNPNALREYTLEPGDALNLELTLRITDLEQVRRLNEGLERIDDVLVLRVTNGRDHFIPIRGAWLQSSFGRSIDKLIRIPEGGVRRLQHQRPDGSNSVKWSAPREVFRLTEAIEELVERAVAEWSMRDEKERPPWEVDGWPFVRESWTLGEGKERERLKLSVREALDTDQAFVGVFQPEIVPLWRLEVLAETLLGFLASLDDGIVPEPLWSELDRAMIEREKAKKLLFSEEERAWILDMLSLSPPHSVSFTFLTFMLARVVNEIAPLKSTLEESEALSTRGRARTLSQDPAIARRQQVDRKLAAIFAAVMIRAPTGGREKDRRASEQRQRQVLEVFSRAK
ncbi:hypothetical protein MMC08_007311 [Hypocenomyce scalaris]|nr:hypothetical protein [Hypocenomyce scalaris]